MSVSNGSFATPNISNNTYRVIIDASQSFISSIGSIPNWSFSDIYKMIIGIGDGLFTDLSLNLTANKQALTMYQSDGSGTVNFYQSIYFNRGVYTLQFRTLYSAWRNQIKQTLSVDISGNGNIVLPTQQYSQQYTAPKSISPSDPSSNWTNANSLKQNTFNILTDGSYNLNFNGYNTNKNAPGAGFIFLTDVSLNRTSSTLMPPAITSITKNGSNRFDVSFNGGNLSTSDASWNYSINGGSSYTSSGNSGTPTIISIPSISANTIYGVGVQYSSGAGTSNSQTTYALISTIAPTINEITYGDTSFNLNVSSNVTDPSGYLISSVFKYLYALDGSNTFYEPTATTGSYLITITGITPNQIYKVVIQHKSSSLISLWTSPSSTEKYALISKTAPFIDSITNESGSSLKVNFTPNIIDTNNYINDSSLNFKYLYSLDGGTSFVETTDKSSPITITTGIIPNAIYNVAIKYTSDAGDSATSTPMYTFISTPPVITSITNEGSGFKVNFTQGVTGTPPTDTLSYWYSLDGGTNFKQASETNSPITITGSLGNTIYRVVIKYKTILTGDSGISNMVPAIRQVSIDPVNSGTSTSPPPVITSITNITDGFIVNFTQVIIGNPGINYYYSLDGGFTFTSSTSGSPITITSGIQKNMVYKVVVKHRINNTDDSGISNMVPAIIQVPIVPVNSGTSTPTPVINSITNDGTSFIVNYTQGSITGSPSTTYYYSIDGGITFNQTSGTNPFTITSGIQKNMVYKVVMKHRTTTDSGISNMVPAVLS